MSRLTTVVRGVALNWVALGTAMVVAFLLSPFLVHHLGDTAYGVWVLVVGAVSFMNLLDLGLRGAVTRYVARGYTSGDHDGASRAVSAGLWLRLWICALVALTGSLLALVFPRLWQITPELQLSARMSVLLVTAALVVTLVGGVFGAVLVALHRFDLQSSVQMGQTLMRAGASVWLLVHGYGIVAIAALEFVVAILGNCAIVLMARRAYPQLRFSLGTPDRETFGKLWAFSSASFTMLVAFQIIWYADNLVVGSFISASAVTAYAIGGNLIVYLRDLVSSMTSTFMPLATSLDAEGKNDTLRQLLIQGTRAVLALMLPVAVALFIRGPSFIGLWMGEQYAPTSGRVLQILVIAQFFALGNATSLGIVYGMAKHRRVAVWATCEALANLTLSIVLVRRFGIFGVAWGTLIPGLFVHVMLWPPYICSLLGMRIWSYVRTAWIRTALPAVPYAFVCYLADRYWVTNHLVTFLLQSVLLLPAFVIPMLFVYHVEIAQLFRRWTEQRSNERVAVSGVPI